MVLQSLLIGSIGTSSRLGIMSPSRAELGVLDAWCLCSIVAVVGLHDFLEQLLCVLDQVVNNIVGQSQAVLSRSSAIDSFRLAVRRCAINLAVLGRILAAFGLCVVSDFFQHFSDQSREGGGLAAPQQLDSALFKSGRPIRGIGMEFVKEPLLDPVVRVGD